MNPKLIKSFTAIAVVAAYSIVSFSVGGVAMATGPTIQFAGLSDNLGAQVGQMVDLIQVGLGEVVAGGPLKAGDPVMSDAEGRAVKAAAVTGQTITVIGFVQADAAMGDIVPILIAPSLIVG